MIIDICVTVALITALCFFLTTLILIVKNVIIAKNDVNIHVKGSEVKLTAEYGTTLLQALNDHNIFVPSPCGGKASCKQCKIKVVAGGGEPLETEKGAYSEKMRKEGVRLACQCTLSNDVTIEYDISSESQMHVATVVSNENVATFIKELVIEVDENIDYKSGEYMEFIIPPYETNTKWWKKTISPRFYSDWIKHNLFYKKVKNTHFSSGDITRAYSLASYPKEGRILKFTIRIATPPKSCWWTPSIEWGVGSSYIFSLQKGDRVTMRGPFGSSHMIEDQRDVIFLIGGAGASFARSHILDILEKGSSRDITLWYGARSMKENIYYDLYVSLEKKYSNFHYNLVLSTPSKENIKNGWDVSDTKKTGYACDAFKKHSLQVMEQPQDNIYYICGPPTHNKRCIDMLKAYGVESSSIVVDDFGS